MSDASSGKKLMISFCDLPLRTFDTVKVAMLSLRC